MYKLYASGCCPNKVKLTPFKAYCTPLYTKKRANRNCKWHTSTRIMFQKTQMDH